MYLLIIKSHKKMYAFLIHRPTYINARVTYVKEFHALMTCCHLIHKVVTQVSSYRLENRYVAKIVLAKLKPTLEK